MKNTLMFHLLFKVSFCLWKNILFELSIFLGYNIFHFWQFGWKLHNTYFHNWNLLIESQSYWKISHYNNWICIFFGTVLRLACKYLWHCLYKKTFKHLIPIKLLLSFQLWDWSLRILCIWPKCVFSLVFQSPNSVRWHLQALRIDINWNQFPWIHVSQAELYNSEPNMWEHWVISVYMINWRWK